jgi:hypothetical protein
MSVANVCLELQAGSLRKRGEAVKWKGQPFLTVDQYKLKNILKKFLIYKNIVYHCAMNTTAIHFFIPQPESRRG